MLKYIFMPKYAKKNKKKYNWIKEKIKKIKKNIIE